MTRAVRWTVRITGALVILVLIGVALVYGFSERQLRAKYAFDARTIVISTDSASVARGDHLFHAITNCALCHDDDAGGKLYADMGPVGLLAGPNLTRGRGGIGSALMAVDYERAIRHGVHRDSTSLIVMPAEVFAYLSDRDVGALIAYLQSVPRSIASCRVRISVRLGARCSPPESSTFSWRTKCQA